MRRGEVWWVALDPSVGGEIQKTRPAVIVSNDTANHYMNRLQVVPLSSKVANLYPGEAYVILNGQQRKAIASQLATVSKLRVQSQVGMLSTPNMARAEQAVKPSLGCSPVPQIETTETGSALPRGAGGC